MVWAAVSFYALAVATLAIRRWACPLPWANECLGQFAVNLETAMLFLWVDDWEAMVAALIALAAAGVGLWVTGANQRERDRQALQAARAKLSHALGDLSVHLNEAAAFLQDIYAQRVGHRIPESALVPTPPSIPWSSIEALAQLTAMSSLEHGRVVGGLINLLQVHSANLREIPHDIRRPTLIYGTWNMHDQMRTVIEINARLTSLYNYARFRSENITGVIDRDAIFKSFAVLNFDEDDAEDLVAELDKIYPA